MGKPGPEEKVSGLAVLSLDLLDAHPANREVFREPTEKELADLADSIAQVGLIHPLKVRPKPDGRYEVVSGHVRLAALKKLGKAEALCLVEENLDDLAAERQMVHANIFGRIPGPMDIARALMWDVRLLSLTKVGKRVFQDMGHQNDGPISGRLTRILAKEYGLGSAQVERYLRLNRLIPEYQALVESGALDATKASEVALLSEETQRVLYEHLKERLNERTVAEVRDMRKRLQELEKEKTASEREAASVQERLIEAEERVRELEREVESFRDRAASLEEDLAREIGEEYERRLRSELSKAEERVQEVQEKLAEARARAQEYRDRLRELQQKLKELQENPVEKVVYRPDPALQKTVEEQRRRITELEAELAETKERLLRAESPEHVKRLREEAEELARRIESLKAQERVYDWSVERKRGPAAFLNVARQLLGPLQRREEEFALLARQTRVAGLHAQEFRQYRAVLARYLGYVDELLGIQDGIEAIDVEGRVVG